MTKSFRSAILTFSAIICVFTLFWGVFEKTSDYSDAPFVDYTLTSDEGSTVALIQKEEKDGVLTYTSDYTIIFASSDKISNDYEFSEAVRSLFTDKGVKSVRAKSDAVQRTPLPHEILIGQTLRDESAELLGLLEGACENADDLAWGFAVIGEKLVYTANSQTAFDDGMKAFLDYLSECELVLPSDLCEIKVKTLEQYEKEQEELASQKREEMHVKVLEMNEAFTDGQFNTDLYTPGTFYKPMTGVGGYYENGWGKGSPWAYPTENVHPRYLITEKNIDDVKAILLSGEDKSSDYYKLARAFWSLANKDIESINFGIFKDENINSSEGPYRYDAEVLAVIEAKALAYLITGDDYYAAEAIVAIKNAMLSLRYTTDLHVDVYHGASHVMITLAAVYDWCYDVLTETDKWHMIWGTAQILGPQMEAGMTYPPTGFNGFNGHGTGPQLLRDWISAASVFYDEAPDWWELVAGRYFNEYLEFTNAQFTEGWVSQGTANYAQLKVHVQAWAAYIIKLATGENFLTDDARLTMYYFMSHITPAAASAHSGHYYFQTGDGTRNVLGTLVGFSEYFVIAALYNDPVIYAQAKSTSKMHSDFSYDTILTMTPALQLCFASAVDYNGEEKRNGVETIQYFKDPASQMTIREDWKSEDSVAVMMRLMNQNMQNHDGLDHGTFQIYYKGLLALSSGSYKSYGSVSHRYYLQSTVAHSGLLVFNPSLASSNSNNQDGYYYSGGQRQKNVDISSAEAWLSSGRMVNNIGADYGYGKDGKAKYAYLAGDLSPAYDEKTVEYAARHMLTVFTDDEDFPAVFLTYDQITAKNESFVKTWLLHTAKEPEIDTDALRATVENGDGKMYVESLFGADAIVKIGGAGKAWWINGYFADPANRGSWDERTQSFTDPSDVGSWVEGKNADDDGTFDDNAGNIWGRIELRAEGQRSTSFLTLMAITDAENESSFEYEKFASDEIYGVQFGKSIVAFANSNEKRYKEFSFTADGTGLYEYYVANVEAGTWQILVDGVSVAYALSAEDGAMITFTAPTGKITVKPSADVIGGNGGRIQYNSGGAVMPENTPYIYNNETATPLPTALVRGDDEFIGWYTSPNYEPESKITEIPVGTTGTVKLYAKWVKCFLNEDYSDTVLDLVETGLLVGEVTYNASGKTGASFITKRDEERDCNYLEWTEGENDPIISQSSANNLSTIEDEGKCVSFTFRLMLKSDAPAMRTNARLIAKHDVNGASIRASNVYLFQTDAKGNVVTNGGSTLAVLSDEVITDIRVVVDFKNGEMRYYDREYNLVITDKWTAPEATGASNTEEYLSCLKEYLWYFYADSNAASSAATLKIYGIKVREGDEFDGVANSQTEGIKYHTGGAFLPEDSPRDFNTDGTPTKLPVMTMNGYIFDGWYTTSTFDEGTKTTEAPAGAEGLYEVWAKWCAIFIDEDYSKTEINLGEGESTTANGLLYGGFSNPGVFFRTETDGENNRYLVWTTGTKDPIINSENTLSNISTMTDSSVSYTITVGKNGEDAIPNFEFRIIGKHTVTGATGVITSNLNFAAISGGVFYLGNGSAAIASIGDEPVTVRIVLDFAAGELIAYGDEGEELARTTMPAVPSQTGATTHLEWKSCFRSYLYYMRKTSGSGAIRIYGIRMEEGNSFKALSNKPTVQNAIKYSLDGGSLSADAPKKYDPLTDTELPVPTKNGYAFGGWFTTPTFDAKAATTYVPAGTEGPYEVWAKWRAVFIDEDYSKTEINLGEGESTEANGLVYGGYSNPGVFFKTETDENNNKYLVWTTGSKDPQINAQNTVSNVSTMADSSVSYTITVGKNGEDAIPNFEFRIIGKHTVTGATGVITSNLNFAAISGGVFYLGNGSAAIASIGDEPVTVRIVLDFAAGELIAYGDEGEELARTAMPAVPSQTGAATHLEWKSCFRSYLYYMRKTSSSGDIRIYGIRMEEGNAFSG